MSAPRRVGEPRDMETTVSTVIRTTRGAVRGTHEDGVFAFRGIPYAEPPVGNLRFRPPQPRAPWDGVLDATRFGPMHLQDPSVVEDRLVDVTLRPAPGADCLNLNVWTPDPGAAGLPVFVWIHGGSLKTGTGSDAVYDGATFARDGVVTVTLNYRLHAAGFLYVPGRPGAGAFGLLDQIAALEWVRANIAAFGGDPDRVTVAGESAGAHSVGQLLAAPAARGLFRRAVLQSGAAFYDVAADVAEVAGIAVLEQLGVAPDDDEGIARLTDADVLAGYRAVEARLDDVFAARGVRPNLMGVVTRVLGLSTYGSDVVPRRAQEAIAAGAAADVDVLIGTTADECMIFPPEFAQLAPVAAAVAFGSDEIFAAYPGSEHERRVRFLTDTFFRIPSIRLAEAAQRNGSRVYSYLLGWGSPPADGGLGAFHAVDVPLVWNRLDAAAAPGLDLVGSPRPVALAEAVHGAWVSFITTGVPQHPALPAWPTYDTTRRATMWLDDESRVVDDPMGEVRELWEGVRY